jgi:parallel beta-helix repeat protein
MVITQDTRFAPGVYHLPNGLVIGADGVTLEGQDTLLVSREHTGRGIYAHGHEGITIRGLSVSGYYHGLRLDGCRNVVIENVLVRDTAEIEGIDTFLYLWHPVEQAYSGAILLNDVQGGVVRGCDLQHQMNGLLLYGCSGLTVERNNASFNSGWGVYLSATSDSLLQDNRLDFCNRVYRRPEDGSIRVEADAAGIVMVEGSSRNRVLRNSCLCGGDGIFVAGFDHKGGVNPCNDNLFEDNDCRLSPNNAIESTFSRGNIFRRNDCSRSNYGFWLGYSWENVLEDNTVEFNRWAGIAVEHGHDMTFRRNTVRLNGDGIRLWTRNGASMRYWPGFEVSYDFIVENNLIESNHTGFAGYTGEEAAQDCHHYILRGNTIRDNRVGAFFTRVHDCRVEDNTFAGNVVSAIRLVNDPDVFIGDNRFEENAADILQVPKDF